MIKLPQDILKGSSVTPKNTGLPSSVILSKNVRVVAVDIEAEMKLAKTSRINEERFPMCFGKLNQRDDLYLKLSDWFALEVFENGKFDVASIFCLNLRHPEFSLIANYKGSNIKAEESIHLSEIEISPDFRGSTYKSGEKADLENPHVCSNIFKMIEQSSKGAGYKMATLQAIDTDVEKIYSSKMNYIKVTEEDILDYLESEPDASSDNLGKLSMLLDSKEFYFKDHPYMYKLL